LDRSIEAFPVFEILLCRIDYTLEKRKVIGLHIFDFQHRPYLIFADGAVELTYRGI
jgi:hypothetical protein